MEEEGLWSVDFAILRVVGAIGWFARGFFAAAAKGLQRTPTGLFFLAALIVNVGFDFRRS